MAKKEVKTEGGIAIFQRKEIVVVEDVVLVTVEVATSEAPTQARDEAARPPE